MVEERFRASYNSFGNNNNNTVKEESVSPFNIHMLQTKQESYTSPILDLSESISLQSEANPFEASSESVSPFRIIQYTEGETPHEIANRLTKGKPYVPGNWAKLYQALPPQERSKVAQEVNQRFRKLIGDNNIVPDPKNPKDRPLQTLWLQLRDKVMSERSKISRGPIAPNKPDAYFLRVYRRNLESSYVDIVETEVFARMSSLFPKIAEHVYNNLKMYESQRTGAKKFFMAGLVAEKFRSTRQKFRSTKDKMTAQVVKEFLMKGNIIVRSDEEKIDDIAQNIKYELLRAQTHYNTAVTSFENTMKTDLPEKPNLDAIMASNLANVISEFDVFQAKSISEFASSKLTQLISKGIIGATLGKIPVFGEVINNFTDLAFNIGDAKKRANEEYKKKLKDYESKKQKVYLADFINNLLKSDTEKYTKFVNDFLANLRRAYDAALGHIKNRVEHDKLRYDFVEIYYDLLDRAERLAKGSKIYELEFYLSWIKVAGPYPADRGLQIVISDPIKQFGLVSFYPRAFITGLYSRNVAKGINDVLKSQMLNVIDLKIQKKVYYLAPRHSDKDFGYVLGLLVSAGTTFWVTAKNHIFFPKIRELNTVQSNEFFKLLSPEMLYVLKATADIDKRTDVGFSWEKAFEKIEMDWNPAIRAEITLAEGARSIFK